MINDRKLFKKRFGKAKRDIMTLGKKLLKLNKKNKNKIYETFRVFKKLYFFI